MVGEITKANGHAIANYDSVVDGHKIVAAALNEWGQVDVLINNAGIAYRTPFDEMMPERWKFMLDVHIEGSYACTRAVWPHMVERGFGRLLFTSSPFGLYAAAALTHYSPAKAAMLGLSKALCLEGAAHNINANALAPFSASRMTGRTNEEQAAREPLIKVYFRHCCVGSHFRNLADLRRIRDFLKCSPSCLDLGGPTTIST